jgi:hypothetical protein
MPLVEAIRAHVFAALITRTEHCLCCLKLRYQHNHARPRITRQALIPIIRQNRQ